MLPSTISCGLNRTGIGCEPVCCTTLVETSPPDAVFTTLRFDDGTTANEPACGAYEAVIDVFVEDTFVVIDDVFVVIDCKTAVELTDIGPDAVELTEITQLLAFVECFSCRCVYLSVYLPRLLLMALALTTLTTV